MTDTPSPIPPTSSLAKAPKANAWAVYNSDGKGKVAGRAERVLIATDVSARALDADAEDLDAEAMIDLALVALKQGCAALPPGGRQAILSSACAALDSAGASEDRARQLRVPTVPVALGFVRDLLGNEAAKTVQTALRKWMAGNTTG